MRLNKVEGGYEIEHRTERVYIGGMPSVRSLSPNDVQLYLKFLEMESGEHQEEQETFEDMVKGL